MKRFCAVAGLMFPLSVLGHHGWSEYDSSKALKLTGKMP